MGEKLDRYAIIHKYEHTMECRKWTNEIPYIKFPFNWEIAIIPPFGGAVVRFVVKQHEARVSVYLDCYDELGYVGEPYWEIYPSETQDNMRFLMKETDLLLEAIQKSLDAR